ncbi:target of Nesh-SH3 isoform X2 [Amphiprion ocellaris]|uniref:target of Nesh-SH3 isoform X2 n=1 Tax=Amphiprion ocellaris TaxID=80972 RepID=UPI0024115A6A|nr:target of Nesh-SH3 isoform X2 [Amphiprion ocellaris]
MMMRRQRHSHTFLVLLLVLFMAGIVLSGPSTPHRSRVRRQNMKVRINATGDTIVMKFVRPNADTKLEGYILGYGSSMFSKQFIQLPENGQPYETEFDAEPKYLIAVQPIPTNEVKKHCTGKVELQKPLHLVIGSVTPTSVLLSWGTLLKTPYEGNIMNDCLEDGHYTVRYRERSRKWNYQTCPTSDTVIDNLKPNTVYEFGVQPNSKDGTGLWSKPVIHNISTSGVEEKAIRKIFKRPISPVKPLTPDSHPFPFSPHHVLHNRTRGRQPLSRNIAPQTTLAPTTTTRQASLSTPGPTLPVVNKQPIGGGDLYRSVLPPLPEAPLAPKIHSPVHITSTMASVPVPNANVDKQGGHLQQRPVSQPHAEPQPNSRLQPYYRPPPQTKPQPQVKPQVKAQPVPKPHRQTEPQLQTTSQPIPQTQPQTYTTSRPKLQTQPQPQAAPQPIPQTKLQTQPQPQATPQPIPQTPPQPQTVLTKLQTQPQPQATPQPIPQTPPQPQTVQTKLQTQPQPQATPQPIPQTPPQPQTVQTKLQTQPQPQATSQPTLQTHPLLQSQPKPHPKSNHQTTPQFHSEPKPKPTFKTKQQTQPQLKPQPQPWVQLAHPRINQPTRQHIPHTQEKLLNTNTRPQTQSTNLPKTQTHLQPKAPRPHLQLTKQPSRPRQTPKPKIIFSQPKPTTQPQSKSQPIPQPPPQPKKQPKPQSQPQAGKHPKPPQRPRIRNQQSEPKTHPRPRPQPPAKTQTQLVPHSQPISKPQFTTKAHSQPLPKPRPVSKPQPLPHPGLHLQPQTRTHSDPIKVTAKQAVPTAPSPPEEGKPLPRPALATEKAGTGVLRPSVAEVPRSPISSPVPTAGRNTTLSRTRVPPHSTNHGVRPFSPSKTVTSSHSSSTPGANGAHHRGNALPKPVVWSKEKPVLRPPVPGNKRPNLVGKPSEHDKPMDLKQGDKESILKPFPLVTAKPKQERRQQTTTSAPAVNSSRFDINENSSIFRPLPASDVDIMGKKRFVAPHVIYKTDKKPDEPCSITSSLAYFPDEEGGDQNVTGPPRIPPSNVTVVTVEGCPSFVILDWQKSDNETREYEVVSTTKGPNGQEVSILTTNQTHTAVENLKPESSYEFKVTPKNELGTGPSSDPVSFSTESADPRVSEYVSGKDAIWTQFPFKADAYSECSGKQYVKRTWYRKFVGIQLCNSLRYKIYLSDSLNGKFYNIGDQTGHGEDHCQFVDSFLDGRTGTQMLADQLPGRPGFYRALRQEPVSFGEIGGKSHVTYVGWYECGTPIPGKW